MGDLHHLPGGPVRREFFVDSRGHGLQMTWHPDQGVIILSVWHEDRCVGTVRLPVTDAARAGAFLLAAMNDWLPALPSDASGEASSPP